MSLIVCLDIDDTAVVLGRTSAQVLLEQHRALATPSTVAAAAAS
ncbi:hypothetical protein [Rhodococcus sp. 24CO]